MYNECISSNILNLKGEKRMVIMKLKLNNIFSFKNFDVNFTYPKKIKNSLVQHEYLASNESFRYKKLNIFIGSNASGKTSLIRSIWQILLFLSKKESAPIERIVNKNYDSSQIEIDVVEEYNNDSYLHRLNIATKNTETFEIKISHKKININSSISYEKAISKLEKLKTNYHNYLDVLNECNFNIGWFTALPSTEESFNYISFENTKTKEEENEYINILFNVLKTLDPSILNVRKSKDSKKAIVITHESNPSLIIQQGMDLSSIQLLSSGTKYGINIANLIYAIKKHRNGIYLIDEQFPYVNSDIEISMLATMASMLNQGEQIFFTTHNTNILSLSFPIHSFYFLNKNNPENRITITCASDFENRNNVSVKNMYDNDIFNTAPNTNNIIGLSNDE